MLPADAFNKFLLLLPLAYQTQAPTDGGEGSSWDYENPERWGIDSPECYGNMQSPIALRSSNSLYAPLPPLVFGNYQKPLRAPLTLSNNGHSVNLDLPATKNGNRPYITGGKMLSKYEAIGLHFHWGSESDKGSEHSINDRRFDVEMHIVHKNIKYETVDEATQHRDGLAVLGIMMKMTDSADRFYPGLNKIFNQLPKLVDYTSNATINGELTLAQLLGDLNTKEFFTYSGSLTTPPCSEAVTWHVFPEPLPISSAHIEKFWTLLDNHNGDLIDNYRPLQPRNKRPVFYRFGPSKISSFRPYG